MVYIRTCSGSYMVALEFLFRGFDDGLWLFWSSLDAMIEEKVS